MKREFKPTLGSSNSDKLTGLDINETFQPIFITTDNIKIYDLVIVFEKDGFIDLNGIETKIKQGEHLKIKYITNE